MINQALPRLFPRRDYSVIEARVKPLVDAMNATGVIVTIASCQGHCGYFRPPYIYFISTISVAENIERALRAYHTDGRLNDYWTLRGIFNEQHQLCFLLEAPRHDERSRSLIRSILGFYGIFRCRLDQDMETLSGLFSEALHDLWQGHEP